MHMPPSICLLSDALPCPLLGDFLVFHLSDVVRTSFLAATSDVLQLRVGGYHALGEVVGLFAQTPDPDYPGHSLLELYQAQVRQGDRGGEGERSEARVVC